MRQDSMSMEHPLLFLTPHCFDAVHMNIQTSRFVHSGEAFARFINREMSISKHMQSRISACFVMHNSTASLCMRSNYWRCSIGAFADNKLEMQQLRLSANHAENHRAILHHYLSASKLEGSLPIIYIAVDFNNLIGAIVNWMISVEFPHFGDEIRMNALYSVSRHREYVCDVR